MARVTSIGAGTTLVCREEVFVAMLREGVLSIGAGAKIVLLPAAPAQYIDEIRRALGVQVA